MEAWIMTAFRETIGIALPSSETEFFSSGIDSLKAIQMRRLILKTLDLKGPRLSPNIVYEKANAGELARHLFALSQGEDIQLEDESILAQQLIEKYSVVERHRYRSGLDYSVNGDVTERWGNAAVRPTLRPLPFPPFYSCSLRSIPLTTRNHSFSPAQPVQ